MPCQLPDEIATVNDDVFSYMCNLAMEKCSKKTDKKKASCGGAAMRKRLLIKNFVAQMLAQDRQSREMSSPIADCYSQSDQQSPEHRRKVFAMIPRLNCLDGFDVNDVRAEISDEGGEKEAEHDTFEEEDEPAEEGMTDTVNWTMDGAEQNDCSANSNAVDANNNRKRKLDNDEEMADGEPEANYSKTCFRIIYDMDKFAFNDGVFNYVACPFG